MIFVKNEEKSSAYCLHSLLKASNNFIFRLTAYMPLSMKLGVSQIRTSFWFILVNLYKRKIMIFAINKENSESYCMHALLKAGNLLRLTIWGQMSIWGHFGSLGSKSHFHQNAILVYVTQHDHKNHILLISLRPSTYIMGSNANLVSFRVTGVKR